MMGKGEDRLAEAARVLFKGTESGAKIRLGREDPEMPDLNMPLQVRGARLVQQLVGEQATTRPEAPALVARSRSITYAELDRRANQFAHYLRGLGVGPEKLVALLVERSPEMVVAALGVLKAGGAYLPLDPSAPVERLEGTLRDADVSVLVTNGSLDRRGASGSFRLVNLKTDADEIGRCPVEAPVASIAPENLAYVIYTSGSTGEPKGVEVTHGNLSNLLSWHLRAFEVTAADRASHQAALGFDAAVWEVWPYLAAGASVYFTEESVRSNPAALRDWLVEQKITITFLATPLAESMMLLDWPHEVDLRILLTGADTLHRRPSALLPFTLVNNYGPTECTVVATSGVVAPAELSSRAPSIGRAIDNTEVLILDEQRKPVAAGIAGELYIGGVSVARGYRNRPELTAQRFVPNPSRSGDRLYRTGDLVRELPSGELEFLGRIDEQIKIRGYRIEPSEIVSALDLSPDVDASAVMAVEDGPGDKRLIAYVALAAGAKTTAGELQGLLRRQLPEYMIPATFVRIDSLPITSNGKVDWAALPLPLNGNVLTDDSYVAPRNIVEEKLAAIIAPLLHVERVSVHDNFFFRGGHSLLGTQLLTRIGETFGVELSLLNLFEHPTLAEMSEEIEHLIYAKLEAAEPKRNDLAPAGMRREDVA
jgi:amino acid adenylation domain-containing protein